MIFSQPIIQNDTFQGIMGLKEFLEYQNHLSVEDRKDIVLVSITDPDDISYVSDNATNVVGFHDVLELKFWDVEEPIGAYTPIDEYQAKRVKDFILKNKDKKFLIHCQAGMSRSAGIGKAVECLLHHNGDLYEYRTSHSEIDDFERYCPNNTVFSKIINSED